MSFWTSAMDLKDVPLAAFDTMVVNHYIWALERFRDHTIERLVNALDGADEEWKHREEHLRSQGADDEHIGDMWADFFFIAIHVEQETRNILAVTLYHLFEKQVIGFTRGALGRRRKDVEGMKYLKDAAKNLETIGLDCGEFASLPTINVLRIVANTTKHGKEGTRPADLDILPRDLFRDPARGGEAGDDSDSRGFGLYVHKHHLDEWCVALLEFWKEMTSLSWRRERITVGSLAEADSEPEA